VAGWWEIAVLMNDVVQVYGTHYNLTGVGATNGGQVQFFFFPPDGAIITALRSQSISQNVQFLANSSYPPLTVGTSFDNATKVDQMLSEGIRRAPRFAQRSFQADVVIAEPQANKFLGWNGAAPWAIENKEVVPASSVVLSNNLPAAVGGASVAGVSTEISRS